MEASAAERNQTSPGQTYLTYPLRMAGGRVSKQTGKLNRKISREKRAGCVLHLQVSYSVMETWQQQFGVCSFYWEPSTLEHSQWSNGVLAHPPPPLSAPLQVHLGGMTCIYLQETIKNVKDCTLQPVLSFRFFTLCSFCLRDKTSPIKRCQKCCVKSYLHLGSWSAVIEGKPALS